MNRENETNDESIKLELKCVSLLCDNWAGPDFLKKKNDFEYKMPHFRDAIIAGQGSGTPEHTPFEFLADDYEAVYFTINYLENQIKQNVLDRSINTWLDNVKVPFVLSEQGAKCIVSLPVLCPPAALEMLVFRLSGIKAMSPSELAATIVGIRLGGENKPDKWDTVKKARQKRKRIQKRGRNVRSNLPVLTFERQLLMSVFFDLSSMDQVAEAFKWRAKILDAFMSVYPVIGVYHMIKISNDSGVQIYTGQYDFDEVEKLFNFAFPNSKEGPFTKLIQASQDNATHDFC